MFAKAVALLAAISAVQANIVVPRASLVNRRSEQQPIRMSLTSISNKGGKELATEEVAEGKSITVTFELARKPTCFSKDKRCFVRVLLENNRPDEVALSQCYVEWDSTDPEHCCENCDGKGIKKMCPYWMEKKTVEITTVEDFVDDGEKDILITTKPAVSESEFFSGRDLPDIEIRTPDKGTAECSSTTDPNYKQFDGGRFTVNTAGTFSLWKAPQRDWEVQGRVDSRGMNCGLAMRDGCDRIVFDRCAGGSSAIQMRKFFDPNGDASLQPKISRDGDRTWIVTSRRSGAQVKVIHRISIVRIGFTRCGWSGCVRSPINTRKEFLDFYLKTPGSDWGWFDSVSDQKSKPKTTGVCGIWSNDRSDDLLKVGSTSKLSAVAYANQFKVTGTSLFDANPQPCQTHTPPVKIQPKQCSIVPRRIQKPVISIFDIEDITEMLKNSLEGEEEDEDDNGGKYNFDVADIKTPTRSKEFEDEAQKFCEAVIKDNDVARRCQTFKVNGVKPDLDQWVSSCYNDIWWQDSEQAGDSTRHMLASSTFDSMENYCIDMRAKSDEFRRGCAAGTTDDCEMAGDICVGDCTIAPTGTFTSMLAARCPNSCGKHFRDQGAGGKCVTNAKGKNVCVCHDPAHWGGEDCTVRTGGIMPHISKIVPHTCQVNKAGVCADEVVVHADTTEGTLFAKGEGVKCKVDGQEVNATFLDQTRIRCHLPAYAHKAGEPTHHRKVSVSLDGKIFAKSLHFCHHDSRCTECDSKKGEVVVKKDTCNINSVCHEKAAQGPGKYDKCRSCDPEHSQTKWKYTYQHKECHPILANIGTIDVNEMHPLHRPINLNNKLRTRLNLYTRGDDVNTPKFSLAEDSQYFSVEADTGLIMLEDVLDFEKSATHNLKVRVTQGGVSHEGTVKINVFDSDEKASFQESAYEATVVENAPAGVIAGLNVSVSDPDGGAFQANTYSLENRDASSRKLPFQIDAVTGVVSTTEPLDHEAQSTWRLLVKATTPSGSVARSHLTIAVADVNEAPTFINLDTASVKENQPVGAKVADITVSDPDAADSHTLTLTGGDGWFEIKGQSLYLAKDGMDYETMPSKTIEFQITATDSKNEQFTETQSIRVEDANDAPGDITIEARGQAHGADVAELKEIPEGTSVGSVIADLKVVDQDLSQEHGFRVVDEDSYFAIAGDSSLKLAKALDFETSTEVTVQLVAFDKSDVSPRTSKVQTFTFKVLDGADVPRDFKLLSGALIPEMSPAGTVVGTVEAVDQDMSDSFVLRMAEPQSAFKVGETKCEQVQGRGTVCRAELSVSGDVAIDFESNRVSLHKAKVAIKLGTTQFDGTKPIKTDCGIDCPAVDFTNAQDAPTGARLSADSIDDVVIGADATATITESTHSLGQLVAIDEDDTCPASIAGCDGFTASGEYTFELVDGAGKFVLSGPCGDFQSSLVRQDSPCSLRVAEDAVLKEGEAFDVLIKVTDKTMESVEHVQKVVVTKSTVAVVVEARSGMALARSEETGALTFADKVMTGQGWLKAGAVLVKGWTQQSQVPIQKPSVISGPFRIGSYSRRSRRSTAEEWTLEVDADRLDADVNPEVTLVLGMAAAGDFEGLTQTFKFAVVKHVPAGPATRITAAGGKARWALQAGEQLEASHAVTLSAFAPAESLVATFAFADPAGGDAALPETVYAVNSVVPDYDGFLELRGSQLVALSPASRTGIPAAASIEVEVQAIQGGVVTNTFAVAVLVDYCAQNPHCGDAAHGSCVQCTSGAGGAQVCEKEQEARHFMCACTPKFMGANCDVFNDKGENVDSKQAVGNGDNNAEAGVGAGAIAGIVIGVVILLVILAVAVVIGVSRAQNRKMEEQRQAVYADVAARDAAAQQMYDECDGGGAAADSVANPMYFEGLKVSDTAYAGYSNDGGAQSITNPNYNNSNC